MNLRIAAMSATVLQQGIEWAAREGWNPGLHDGPTFHATDPEGFLGGWLDDALVGMVSAVAYGHTFGFVGFYLVQPEHRGHGHGLALWRAAMQRMGERVIGLDGVVAQQDNYRRSGFVWAHANVRYEGRTVRDVSAPDDRTLVELGKVPFQVLADYDRACFAEARATFLKGWIAQPGSHALGRVVDGTLKGYGVIRPCRHGCKIGPLFADTAADARSLMQALMNRVPTGTPVQFDPPQTHPDALALARSFGMQPVFETARMYRGPAPALAHERVFGITTFELG
jgi:GNAT superfamily N-acetyltransferase